MIIYGSRGTHFSTQDLPHTACPSCGTHGKLQLALVSQYAHVYFIPLFPFKKAAIVQCNACYTDWADNGWSPELAPTVREVKSQTAHPYWTWLGVVLIGLAMAYGAFASIRNDHHDDALLETPQAGDIYTVRSDSANTYSLLKVRQVSGNSVELVANEYETSDVDPINSINQPSRYSKEPFVITRLDLQIMRRKGELTDVDRME